MLSSLSGEENKINTLRTKKMSKRRKHVMSNKLSPLCVNMTEDKGSCSTTEEKTLMLDCRSSIEAKLISKSASAPVLIFNENANSEKCLLKMSKVDIIVEGDSDNKIQSKHLSFMDDSESQSQKANKKDDLAESSQNLSSQASKSSLPYSIHSPTYLALSSDGGSREDYFFGPKNLRDVHNLSPLHDHSLTSSPSQPFHSPSVQPFNSPYSQPFSSPTDSRGKFLPDLLRIGCNDLL